MPAVDDFRAAGLYDAGAPDAAARLALLEYLVERGATLEELVEADAHGRLAGVGGDLVRRGGRTRVTPRELADEGVIPLATFDAVWRAAGLAGVDPDAPVLAASDRVTFASFVLGAELFGEATTLQFTRVIGAAVASIADAATAMFGLTLDAGSPGDAVAELDAARTVFDASRLLVDGVPPVIEGLFLHHFDAAVHRYLGSGGGVTAAMAVGFLDLVGSSRLAQELSTPELGAAISAFEQQAAEVVGGRGGRLVKTIGDEVMFVTTDAESACSVALELAAFAHAHPVLTDVRGALAFGPLARGYGDYYGTVVNLAARAVKHAAPGGILIDAAMGAELRGASGFRVTPAGAFTLRGVPEPVELFAVEVPTAEVR